MAQDEATRSLVPAMQQPTDGVAFLRVVLADDGLRHDPRQELGPKRERLDTGKQHAHRRIEGDRQQRCDGHGQGLGEGQRPEQSALLVDQGEHRQEGDGDDQEREEDARPDLDQRFQAHLVKVALLPVLLPMINLVVGVLDLDDGSVDEHADRDGDAGQ